MDSTEWQGIMQYWRADTVSAHSVGRTWWWFLHREEYLILFRVARDYLSILGRQYRIPLPARLANPALVTTIEVERPSSQGGILLSHIHSRLTPRRIHAAMCMHSWSHTGFVDLVNHAVESTLQEEYS